MLYTTYFAKLNSLPKCITPIAICGKSPDSYKGLQYKKLAPKWSFFSQWKETHDNYYYAKHYQAEVLNTLKPDEVYKELVELAGGNTDIALVCYEKPENFCHRSFVRNWFMVAGYDIKEYGC